MLAEIQWIYRECRRRGTPVFTQALEEVKSFFSSLSQRFFYCYNFTADKYLSALSLFQFFSPVSCINCNKTGREWFFFNQILAPELSNASIYQKI